MKIIFICLLFFALNYVSAADEQQNTTDIPTDDPSIVTAVTDTSRVTTVTTSKPPITTIPPSKFPSFYVEQNDTVCLLFQTEAVFHIEYIDKNNKSQTATVNLNSDNTPKGFIKCEGTCDPKMESIVVKWTPVSNASVWSLTVDVQKVDVKGENGYFYLSNVTLTGNKNDSALFKNSLPTGVFTMSQSGSELFKTTMGSYYICKNEHKVEFNKTKSYSMMSNFKIEPFRTSKKLSYEGNPNTCPEDILTNNIVPIAVGAALAAMVLIVLITYLIGRRRRSTGYQSI